MTVVADRGGERRLRSDVAVLFDDDDPRDWRPRTVRIGLILLVLLSVASLVLETVPELFAQFGPFFRSTEDVAVTVFTLEYGLRLWCAPDQPHFAGVPAWRGRWLFARSAPAIVDLLSVLPALIGLVVGSQLSIFLLLRLLRFFKLARYSPGMRSLAHVLEIERKALLASAVILLGFVLLSAAAMYAVEHEAQPDKLGSIPAAMWWAIVTLTTVGYGDIYPITVLGRLVASVTMVLGLMMLALPVGIVATAFVEEIHRREFVVSWGMIARVPLFATLSAAEIGDITRYLIARTVNAGEVIVRKGDKARSMFVITSGEVEVELPTGPVRLGEGQFFGERAMLENAARSATVRAAEASRLLVLEARDLQMLMDRNPEIGERIKAVARERQVDTVEARPS